MSVSTEMDTVTGLPATTKERSGRSATLLFVREQLSKANLRTILPPHIPVDRFIRVVDTAVQNSPKILDATPRSVFNAAMRAASDGLLPDGREGAIVPFKDWKASKATGCDVIDVQWMPMVAGILKKIRNSGQVAVVTARVVYEGDSYRYWIDDSGEHLHYEPADNANRDVVRKVFAMARTKDGEVIVEPLSPADIEKIRSVSRAKNDGPWVDWWDEMAKKSAIRRLSKRLPMSTDLDDLIRRDDALYDFDAAREEAKKVEPPKRSTLSDRLDRLANGRTSPVDSYAAEDSAPPSPHDLETGEIIEAESEVMQHSDSGPKKATEDNTAPRQPEDTFAAGGETSRAANAAELEANRLRNLDFANRIGEAQSADGGAHPLEIPEKLRRPYWLPLTHENLGAWVAAQTDPHKLYETWNDKIAPRLPVDGLSFEDGAGIVQSRIKELEP